MKTLKRNRKIIWYAQPTGERAKTYDAYGRYTGTQQVVYADPVEYDRLSTMARKGVIKTEPFGLSDDYVDSFVTDDMQCPIKAETRLWIDTPAYNGGVLLPHTHVVQAVIPSINVIRILAKNVSVTRQ